MAVVDVRTFFVYRVYLAGQVFGYLYEFWVIHEIFIHVGELGDQGLSGIYYQDHKQDQLNPPPPPPNSSILILAQAVSDLGPTPVSISSTPQPATVNPPITFPINVCIFSRLL